MDVAAEGVLPDAAFITVDDNYSMHLASEGLLAAPKFSLPGPTVAHLKENAPARLNSQS